jgi:AcrR family transcriptional regulator
MEERKATPLSGRRAQAARNDELILAAARTVFVADPGAPIAAVAARAGVGIAALYRRYASKEELLRRLSRDGLELFIAEAEAALTDTGDPWHAFSSFVQRIVEADTGSLALRLAGSFTPTEELNRAAEQAHSLLVQLVERTRADGAIRADVVADDIALLLDHLAAVRLGDVERTRQLRRRYLALMLDGLHCPDAAPLPGPEPSWAEVSGRWDTGHE